MWQRLTQENYIEMIGFIDMGNNPMVGATVACAVAVNEAINKQIFVIYN